MLIVDTGVVLAASDSGDPDHVACAGLLQDSVGPLIRTALVIAESAYLIGRQLGAAAESRFFRSIADGEITVEPLSTADDLRIADLVEQYASLPLGGTDASVPPDAEPGRLPPSTDQRRKPRFLRFGATLRLKA